MMTQAIQPHHLVLTLLQNFDIHQLNILPNSCKFVAAAMHYLFVVILYLWSRFGLLCSKEMDGKALTRGRPSNTKSMLLDKIFAASKFLAVSPCGVWSGLLSSIRRFSTDSVLELCSTSRFCNGKTSRLCWMLVPSFPCIISIFSSILFRRCI